MNYWVDESVGSDAYAGTKEKPFKTIERAIYANNVKNIIVVKKDYIPQACILPNGINLIGYCHYLTDKQKP